MTVWETAFRDDAELAERPLWDERTETVVWVDITRGRMNRLEAGGACSTVELEPPVGACALRAGGGLVAAHAGVVRFLDAEGREDRPPIRFDLAAGVRFNDGACDPAGRFLVGTCSTDGQPGRGSLYAVEPDGRVRVLLTGVTESNGLAWSPRGETMYYVDSGHPDVRAYAYDAATGGMSDGRVLRSFGPADGVPDGLIVDRDGAIWVALWEGSAVVRIDPDGAEIGRLAIPVSRPTCPALGGHKLDRLFVTTAWEGLDGAARAREPLAGSLLATSVPVPGLPALRFAG